jgi:enoyl-CoA hydratase
VSNPLILVDDPAPMVRRVTLNRPETRTALNDRLRHELIAALQAGDGDPDVRVTIIRGAGKCFSAGYDLSGKGDEGVPPAYHAAAGLGMFQRNVTQSWMSIWDLAKPVIAQVHSYCLAGGTELATGCDLVYVAEDAQIGYPAVRFGVPDMQYHAWMMGMRNAMESVLTGDSMTGIEAARNGFANRAYPAEELEERVLQVAQRIATIPSDISQINKRTVHRAMEVMGMRAAIRSGTELCTLSTATETFKAFMADRDKSLTAALSHRDSPFGDYRTAEPSSTGPAE